VRQCDCPKNNWTVTWTSDHVDYEPTWTGDKPDWWKEVTCHDDNVMNNPVTYDIEQIQSDTIGDLNKKVYTNVTGTSSNRVQPNGTTTLWNSTQTIHNGDTRA